MIIKFKPKSIKINATEYMHFWYNNSKGRDNVTIIKSEDIYRASRSAKQAKVKLIVKATRHWGKIFVSPKYNRDFSC